MLEQEAVKITAPLKGEKPLGYIAMGARSKKEAIDQTNGIHLYLAWKPCFINRVFLRLCGFYWINLKQ